MTLVNDIKQVSIESSRYKHHIFNDIVRLSQQYGLVIDDVDLNKPWGWYIRFESNNAEKFVGEFFPGLTMEQAQLGNPEAPLSPKFLLVSPGEILSWQYHDRRAERLAYITDGGYFKSKDDEQGGLQTAKAGDVVQFDKSERHRLVGNKDSYVLVAEIWQHTDPDNLSDEVDIVRLEDKYKR